MKTDLAKRVAWVLLVGGAMLSFDARVVHAQRQQRPQRFQPATPTVSPYLNLLRQNNSPIPNYYSLVRPALQQQQINLQQQTILRQQNAEIRQLQTNLLKTQTEGPVSGSPSWFQTPGTRSTFLNTSQFYSRSGTAAAR